MHFSSYFAQNGKNDYITLFRKMAKIKSLFCGKWQKYKIIVITFLAKKWQKLNVFRLKCQLIGN